MTVLAWALVVLGLIGIVVPVLPGLILVWAGIAVWATSRHDAWGWVVLAGVSAVLVLGIVTKYLLPGRKLRESGVPWSTLAAGAVLAVIGFVVVPVVGVVLGFVLGVFLAELARLRDRTAASAATRVALAAVGWSIVVELGTGLVMTAVWVIALVVA
jgi:uncharacterized protein